MQMTAFRGSRTVMSLRLCSRAPWTTSSSTAIDGPLYRPNVRSYRVFSASYRGRASQALRQRPNTRPPRVKPSPNVPTAKPPIAMPLRQVDRRCQWPERLALLVGQRLAPALLAQCAAGPKAEIEIVEDLDRLLVGHLTHCIACFAGVRTHPACQRPPRRRTGGPVRGVRSGRRSSSVWRPELIVASGDLTHQGTRAQHETAAALLKERRRAGSRRAGEPRHPAHLPRALHALVGGVRALLGARPRRCTPPTRSMSSA